MTNPISSVPQTPLPPEATSASSAPKSATQDTVSAPQGEAVTLSAAAQASTQLLGAARDASGVDAQAVARIRGALQNGSYNVAAEDLAQAIATVLKETN